MTVLLAFALLLALDLTLFTMFLPYPTLWLYMSFLEPDLSCGLFNRACDYYLIIITSSLDGLSPRHVFKYDLYLRSCFIRGEGDL